MESVLNQEQKIWNSLSKFWKIEKYRGILEDVGIYKLVCINKYVLMKGVGAICAKISQFS